MKSLAVLAVLVAGGAAHAEAKRKPKPDKFAHAAGAAFAEAMALEDAGKVHEAIQAYRRSFELVPHPNTAFNIAELLVRGKRFHDAIATYEMYLVMRPDAPDRAYVVTTVDELLARPFVQPLPFTSADGIDKAKSFVVVDGRVVRKPGGGSPTEIELAQGFHSVDHVTPVTFDIRDVEVTIGGVGRSSAPGRGPKARAPGNVMIRMSDTGRGLRLRFRGEKIDEAARITAPPGTYRVAIADRTYECPPITIVVPKSADHVVYVHVSPAEFPSPPMAFNGLMRCRKLAVRTQVLAFE